MIMRGCDENGTCTSLDHCIASANRSCSYECTVEHLLESSFCTILVYGRLQQ